MIDTYTKAGMALISEHAQEAKKAEVVARELITEAMNECYPNSREEFLGRLVAVVFNAFRSNFSTAAYHNVYHAYCMVANCDMLYRENRPSTATSSSRLQLLMAALFHDYGHSGGVFTDAHNVSVATKFVVDALMPTFGIRLISNVERIISVTQYPYVREPADSLEQIIRDADLIQGASPCHELQVFYGLYSEMVTSWGVKKTQEARPTLSDFAKLQEEFMGSVTFFHSSKEFSNKVLLAKERCAKEALMASCETLRAAFPNIEHDSPRAD